MSVLQEFGFLNYSKTIIFDGGRINPFPDFEERALAVNKDAHKDGFYYPPTVKELRVDLATGKPRSTVPRSKKPASVFRLPPSHNLILDHPLDNNDLRKEDAGLLIHLLAFFFGTRLQFSDWKFDGKVPLKSMNSFTFTDEVPGEFISHVYCNWRRWDKELRRRYINILYVHTKSWSCDWWWDAFMYRYMVFDALYKLHTQLGNPEITGHKNRLTEMCKFYSIRYSEDEICNLYKFRNELFHEALWDGETPGYGGSDSHLVAKWMDKLVSRLIVSIAGYRNDYSSSGWWYLGWESFGLFNEEMAK